MQNPERLRDDLRRRSSRSLAALHLTAFKGLLLTLAIVLSGPVLAAGFTCAQSPETVERGTLDELDEVVVTAEEATTTTQDLQAWLKLLVGKFTYEGHVDLCGKGNAKDQRPVTGKSDCVASGSTPNVHCTLNVRWPSTRAESGAPVLGGVANLQPAFVIYTLEKRPTRDIRGNLWGLMFTQVDNRGIAEWGSGMLVGDTFTSRESCVDMPGACQKITRITARPGSNEIVIRVDVTMSNERVLRQAFLLHREATANKARPSGGSSR